MREIILEKKFMKMLNFNKKLQNNIHNWLKTIGLKLMLIPINFILIK